MAPNASEMNKYYPFRVWSGLVRFPDLLWQSGNLTRVDLDIFLSFSTVFFTHSMDVVALDVLQILVVTGNIEEAKSSSAIFFLPCPQNRATLGQIVQIVITTKSTTKFLLERRGASLQRGL